MSDVVVKVEGLGKQYRLGGAGGGYTALRDVIAQGARDLAARALGRGAPPRPAADDAFWSLRGIDCEIRRGEVVGIVGRNGAGKSTLLKILSRITEPSEGRVTIRGRVASLLEIGTGFHPELTGRENIFLNGAILGMSRAEIRAKFDAIVAFAETERFLDVPVKRYSSGMYVRLAFAVAAHLEAEILIVDEVLAVGDAEFQARCLGKLGQVARDGRTVLFVSHNLSAVERLCTSALLLDRGRVAGRGPVAPIARQYLEASVPSGLRTDARKVRTSGDLVRVIGAELRSRGKPVRQLQSGDPCEFLIAYECLAPNRLRFPPGFLLKIHLNGQLIFNLWSEYIDDRAPLEPSGTVRCIVPRWPVREGAIRVDIYVHVGSLTQDWIEDVLSFTSFNGPFYGPGPLSDGGEGLVFVDHSWGRRIDRNRDGGIRRGFERDDPGAYAASHLSERARSFR